MNGIFETRGRPKKYDYTFDDLNINEAMICTAPDKHIRKGKASLTYANSIYAAAKKFYSKKGQTITRRVKGIEVYIIRTA